MSRQCRKCGAYATSTYFSNQYYCQDCETKRLWDNGDKVYAEQMALRRRMIKVKEARKKIDEFVDDKIKRGLITRENIEEME